MHKRAYNYLATHGVKDDVTVFEFGSRDINGTARDHWPNANWTGIDLYEGPGVDIVADIFELIQSGDWRLNQVLESADLVVCAEMAEHCNRWGELAGVAFSLLKKSGKYLGTAAGTQRKPHSAVDGGKLRSGEYYGNISASDMLNSLHKSGFQYASVVEVEDDIQWYAIK